MKRIGTIFLLAGFTAYVGLGMFYTDCPEEEAEHHGNCEGEMMEEHQQVKMPDGPAYEKACFSFGSLVPTTTNSTITAQEIGTLVAALFRWDKELPEQEYFPVVDPRCNCGPPLRANSLRAPPIV